MRFIQSGNDLKKIENLETLIYLQASTVLCRPFKPTVLIPIHDIVIL